MYLLITESPAKAKKIQGFLSNQYNVKSSCGHIRDLEKKKTKRYGNPADFGINVEDNFKPTYKIMSDKKDVVKMLKDHSKNSKIICGESNCREVIAGISSNLKAPIDIKNRIVFREISKKAILKAIESPIQINMDEVNAQQAREIIDNLLVLNTVVFGNISNLKNQVFQLVGSKRPIIFYKKEKNISTNLNLILNLALKVVLMI